MEGEEKFKAHPRDRFLLAYEWMDWLRHIRGVDIRHKLNAGGKYRFVVRFFVNDDISVPLSIVPFVPLLAYIFICIVHSSIRFFTRSLAHSFMFS